jgi:hypothetical protein
MPSFEGMVGNSYYTEELFVSAFEEWLANDVFVFLEDLELSISACFADVNILGKVVIGL